MSIKSSVKRLEVLLRREKSLKEEILFAKGNVLNELQANGRPSSVYICTRSGWGYSYTAEEGLVVHEVERPEEEKASEIAESAPAETASPEKTESHYGDPAFAVPETEEPTAMPEPKSPVPPLGRSRSLPREVAPNR